VTTPVLAGVVVQSVGEAAGYVVGAGGSTRDVVDIELRRFDHLARGDAVPEDPRAGA
jgi:hypothetical protein